MANDIYLQYGIDSNKLKRNYIKYPLHITTNGIGSERPYKEDLKYLYIILNLSVPELKKYFNISQPTIKRWLKYYNIKKSIKLTMENVKKTCIEKY